MTACETRANSSTPASRTIFTSTAPSSASSEIVGTSVGTSDVGPSVGGNDGVTVEGGVSGAGVGPLLGTSVGSVVGSSDGCRVGDAVDNAVGGAEGSAVGDSVGNTVGTSVGRSEGNPVGISDGSSDGDNVGCRDGSDVADCVMPRVGVADGWTLALSCERCGQLAPPSEDAIVIARERMSPLLASASQAAQASQLRHEVTTQSTGQVPTLHWEFSCVSVHSAPSSKVSRLRCRMPVSQEAEQALHSCKTTHTKADLARERKLKGTHLPHGRQALLALRWFRWS